jgi:amino acid transporter
MKSHNLYVIDIILCLMLIIVFVNSLSQEILGGRPLGEVSNLALVIFHLVVCFSLMGLSFVHIKAHYGKLSNWKNALSKGRNHTKWVLAFAVLAIVTGVVSTVTYFSHGHTPLGGVHGKIALVSLLLMTGHLVKRFNRLKNLNRKRVKSRTLRVSGSKRQA